MASSMGWGTALAIDLDDGTFDSSSKRLEFVPPMTLGATTPIIKSEGIRGTRSRFGERIVQGQISVGGDINLEPTPDELDYLLPLILGANESTDVFAVADTLQTFWVLVDRVAKCHRYAGCYVSKAVFEFAQNQLMKLTMSVVGKTETELSSGSFTAGSISALQSYIIHQLVLTLHGSTRQFERAVLTIDNAPEIKHYGAQAAQVINPGDRIVTLATTLPYDTTNADVYTNQAAGTWANGSAVATNGNRSITFTLNSLRALDLKTSEVAQRNAELGLPLTFQAFQTTTTKEISITNDSSG